VTPPEQDPQSRGTGAAPRAPLPDPVPVPAPVPVAAPPPAAPPGPLATGAAAAQELPALRVADQLEARMRMPADLLRCVIACVEIALLAALALVGVKVDVVGAADRAQALLGFLAVAVSVVTLLVLPLALAVRTLLNRQLRRLAEAVLAGCVTIAAVTVTNLVLRLPFAADLYGALVRSPHPGHPAPLDAELAAVVSYITVIGLSGRSRWRSAFWLAIGFDALVILAHRPTTLFALLITLLAGSAIGSGLRYAVGSTSGRPSAEQIAAALGPVAAPVAEIRRVFSAPAEIRRYAATLRGGGRLDITVFDRDQQTADALYRLYRRLRLQTQVSRSAPLTVERAVERQALLTYAAEDAGVLVPRLRAVIRVGPEAAVLANEHQGGTTLAEQASRPSDEQLRKVWDAVLRLHSRRVTHRMLTADRILFTGGPGGEVVLLEPGNGDVAATDLQLRLDLVQLLAELALLVGPDRAVSIALEKIGSAELVGVVPLLQPIALHRSTRATLRRRKDVLPALRKRLQAAAPGGEAAPVQLERIRPRTVLTLVAAVVASYILVGQLAKVNLGELVRHADWDWSLVALALSVVTYLGAALSLSGFVLERLNRVRTLLAQVAGSFVTLVTPAAVGGVALNIRYLRRANVAPADAAASVGVSQVIAFAVHLLLLVVFVAVTGTSQHHALKIPGGAYIVLAALVAAVLVVLAVPGGRRLLRSRLAPALGEVIPRLLDVAQRPAKLAQGIGGALLLTTAYILCLAASVRALGGSAPIASIAVVYLTGSAIGSIVPTPGGLGAVEAALTAGLTAAGLHSATALSSVLLFRLVSFWLPVPFGWASLNYLQRRDAL
jgi:glycosyltransferase 2 family protein